MALSGHAEICFLSAFERKADIGRCIAPIISTAFDPADVGMRSLVYGAPTTVGGPTPLMILVMP
jgi:hypothetical protein